MYIANNRISPAGQLPGPLTVPGVPPTAAEMAIVGFIIIVGLYFGQVVLVPLALAVILSFVLAPARASSQAHGAYPIRPPSFSS